MADDISFAAVMDTGNFDAGTEIITGALRHIGTVAVDALFSAGAAVASFIGDSFAGALEAEQNMARLGQVIESTGGIAGVTVREAEALADEFKNLAGGSDDAVISIIDMGLRMGTISEEMMPAFIQSTLDLGAVMGDAGRASQLMARAVEDPVGVLGALRKAGILVNETTEAQIKAMVKSGDTAGAYALLMGRVEEATAGAAETMAMTTAGQWAIFTETVADAGETIVGAFLPAIMSIGGPILETVVPAISELAGAIGTLFTSLLSGDGSDAFSVLVQNFGLTVTQAQAVFAVIDMLSLGFQNFIGFIQSNMPLMQETFTTVWTAIQGVLAVVGDFVTVTLMPALAMIWGEIGIQLPTAQQTFESVMAGIVAATQMVSDFITNVLVPVMTAAVDWVVTNWPAIEATATEVWTQVQAAIQTATDYINGILATFLPQMTTNVQTTLTGLTAFWDEHGAQIMAIVETSFNTMATVIAAVLGIIGATVTTSLTLLSGLFAATMQAVNGDWSGAWDTITATIVAALNGILAFVNTDLASFQSSWTSNWEMARTIVSTAWANMGTAISDSLTTILANIVNTITQIVDNFQAIDWVGVGSALINNIASGIGNAVGNLIGAAQSAASNAYNAILDALHMHSPSPMLIAVGEQVGADLSRGLAQSESQVSFASRSMGDSIVSGLGLSAVCAEIASGAYDIGNDCLPDALSSGVAAATGKVIGTVYQYLGEPILGALDNIGTQAVTAGQNIAVGLSNGMSGAVDMVSYMMGQAGQAAANSYVAPIAEAVDMITYMMGNIPTPPVLAPQTGGFSFSGQPPTTAPPSLSTGGTRTSGTSYINNDSRQFNLNVSTNRNMQNVGSEFATMQTLAGLT